SFFGVDYSLIPQAISLQHVWALMNILLADSVWLAQVYRRICVFVRLCSDKLCTKKGRLLLKGLFL
ncbi:TPA: hypothetical protein ACMDNY_003323, partial [Vibrio metschnikovii]